MHDALVSFDRPGICRELTPAQAGDSCGINVLSSRDTGTTFGTIELYEPIGSCDYSQGLICDPIEDVCAELLPLDAPCDSNCQRNLYCDGTCKAAKPLGSPCTADIECGWPAWCPEGTCKKFAIADSTICNGNMGDVN